VNGTMPNSEKKVTSFKIIGRAKKGSPWRSPLNTSMNTSKKHASGQKPPSSGKRSLQRSPLDTNKKHATSAQKPNSGKRSLQRSPLDTNKKPATSAQKPNSGRRNLQTKKDTRKDERAHHRRKRCRSPKPTTRSHSPRRRSRRGSGDGGGPRRRSGGEISRRVASDKRGGRRSTPSKEMWNDPRKPSSKRPKRTELAVVLDGPLRVQIGSISESTKKLRETLARLSSPITISSEFMASGSSSLERFPARSLEMPKADSEERPKADSAPPSKRSLIPALDCRKKNEGNHTSPRSKSQTSPRSKSSRKRSRSERNKNGPCDFWEKTGTCKRSRNCWYYHGIPQVAPPCDGEPKWARQLVLSGYAPELTEQDCNKFVEELFGTLLSNRIWLPDLRAHRVEVLTRDCVCWARDKLSRQRYEGFHSISGRPLPRPKIKDRVINISSKRREVVSRNPQFRTRMCVYWKKGNCDSKNCNFAHGHQQLRRRGGKSIEEDFLPFRNQRR